ncbi:hypothetical protein QDX81_02025 [Pseudomonas sp. CW003PS]|nr:hypothetical protein QDX81_02025 [Pseudomonas sp. CW003PS]
MKPIEILLRCYMEKKNGYWQAFCIDLSLAVQGDTIEEVKGKLHEQIYDYLNDIFEGEDRPYASQLLNRKAPLYQRAKYHFYKLRHDISGRWDGIKNSFTFQDTLPVKLA